MRHQIVVKEGIGNGERGTEEKDNISYCYSVIKDRNRCIVSFTTVCLRYFSVPGTAINLFINLKKIGLAI